MITHRRLSRALMLGAMMGAGLVCVTFAPRAALAQTSKGTLTGIVRDGSGAVVVGASVTVSDVATGETRSATTTSLGAYRLDAITPGQYTLRVESTGFELFEAKGLTVPASLVISYDVELKLGHLNETVSVSASNVLLNQENGSLSQTISGEALVKLPIFSLNPIELLTTVPGVQVVSNTEDTNGEEIQVSGARPRANNFMIDGEEINDATIAGQAVQPNIPDMYSDVIIYTHNPPAEFGRASGGVVNLITKGGTNTFHGSSWELYSGSGLNSTDGQQRQLTPSRSNKPRYDQHQFGFTVGGPVIKDKLFAFGAAQWSRYYGNEVAQEILLPNTSGIALLKELAGSSGTVATNAALMLQYLSSGSYVSTFADLTPQSPAAAGISLGAACSPTDDVCNNGLQVDTFLRPAAPEQNPDTQWTYRIDYTPWTKDTFTARYLHDRSSLTPDFFANGSSMPGFDTEQGGFSELGQGTWTHIFSTHILNEFRASETRLSFAFAPTAQTLANPLYNAPNIDTPEIQNLGFDQTDFPQGRGQDMYQFQDTVSWTHGRNTVRAGADIGRRIEKDLNAVPVNGVLSFADGGDGSTGVGNFLLNELGPSGTATRTFGNPDVDPHSWRSGIFGQDDVKLSPSLTLNLGVRWDYFTNPDNSLPYPAINPSTAATLYGPIDTVYKVAENKHSFAPRVGFAYSPRQGKWLADGKTVVRGGFGIFFDPEFTNITTNDADSAPNVAAGEIQQTNTVIGNATGLLATISPQVSQFSTVDAPVNNLTSPYSEEWNLGVERVLPGQIALSITYVGSRGVKLFANQQYNYEDFNTGERLDPSRGVIIARGNFADSRYNGLEVGGKHNFSHGLAVTGSYVYSKSLDDGSDIFAPDSSPTSYSANLAPGGRHQ
ncbi:MAG: TonB-dependent receptor, partial [Terracidiphilus sp.]